MYECVTQTSYVCFLKYANKILWEGCDKSKSENKIIFMIKAKIQKIMFIMNMTKKFE